MNIKTNLTLCILAVGLLAAPLTSHAFNVTKTMSVSRSGLPDNATLLDLSFIFGGATVSISVSDNESLIAQATVVYDSLEPEPELRIETSGTTAQVSFASGLVVENIDDFPEIEQWDVVLGPHAIPTDLSLIAGGLEGEIDLGGLPLRKCMLTLGGAGVSIDFSRPTSRAVELIRIDGGGLDLNMHNIGNSNFGSFQMIGGGYIADLNFNGALEDGSHTIDLIGAGNLLDMTLPADAGAGMRILSVASAISVRGAGWTTESGFFFYRKYITTDYDGSTRQLDLSITAAASLIRVQRD